MRQAGVAGENTDGAPSHHPPPPPLGMHLLPDTPAVDG